MRTYRDGTLSLTNASTTITGVGTLFIANVAIGDIIICENSQCFEVVSITDNTHLVVDVAAKQTGSFKYGCLRFVTAVNFRDLSVKIEQFLADRQTNLAEFTTWMTGSKTGGPTSNGYYPLTDRFGVTKQYACPELLAFGYVDAQAQATAAAASASAANSSKTAAATSATAAAGSATAANTSKVNAGTSETNALASKNAAATSATNAATSETNALASKNAAATSQTAAAGSATAAATSATAAAASAVTANTTALSGIDKVPDNWIANPQFDVSGTLVVQDNTNGKTDYVDRDAAGVPVGFSCARVARSLKKLANQLTYVTFPVIGSTNYIPVSPGQIIDASVEVAVVSGTALAAGNGSARMVIVETAMDGTSSTNTRILSYDNAKGGVQVLTASFTTLPTTYKMTVAMWNESNMPVNAIMYYGAPVIRKRDSGISLLSGRSLNMVPDPTYSAGAWGAWASVASVYDKTSASVPAGASSPHVIKASATSAITYFKFNRDPVHACTEFPTRLTAIQAAEGDIFEASVRVFVDVAAARNIRFNCDFVNAANATTNFNCPSLLLGTANGWTTLTATFTVPAGMVAIVPQIRIEAGTACDVYFGEIYFGRQSVTEIQNIKDQLGLLGLGTTGVPLLNDLNDVTTSGMNRYSSTTLNSPFTGQSGAVLTEYYSATYIGQIALHMGQGSTVGNKMFYRSMSNGVWNQWLEMVSFDSLGKVVGWGSSNTTGVLIPASTDLNTYQTPGAYGQNLSANATLVLNYPTNRAGSLLVMRAANNMVAQIYIDYQTGDSWTRSLYQTTWSAWRKAAVENGFTSLANTTTDTTTVPSASDSAGGVLPAIRLSGNAASGQSTLALQGYSFSTTNFGASFVGTRSQGVTPGTHGAVPASRSVCTLVGAASDGVADYRKVGRIDFYTEETASPTSSAGQVRVLTTPPGAVIPTLAATFTSDGRLNVVGGGSYGGALNISGGDLTVNGEVIATGTSGVRADYRMGIIRNNGIPYMTFARSDLPDGANPAADSIILSVQGKTASADVNNFDAGRTLGAYDVLYMANGAGRARIWARSAAGATTALITLDGAAGTNTVTGNLITSNRIDARGSIDEAVTVTVASAATTDIASPQANTISVTGTTTITALGTATAGVRREVKFAGILTLTHNATTLNLPGNANIVTAAGDIATFTSKGSGNWDCTNYMRTNGVPIVAVAGLITAPGAINEAGPVTLSSAATTNMAGAASNVVTVTGTTTITSLGTVAAGVRREAKFTGILTLTHNATSLNLPGNANIVTAAGDVAQFTSKGSGNWDCTSYVRADGTPVTTVPLNKGGTGATTLAGAQAALGLVPTSGQTDTSVGRVLRVGDFGLGAFGSGLPVATNLNTTTAVGFYMFGGSATGVPSQFSGSGGSLIVTTLGANFTQQIAQSVPGSTSMPFMMMRHADSSGVFGPWVKMFHSNNIVGNVTQASGLPTGAVIETGTTAAGTYIKYADGTLICHSAGANNATGTVAVNGWVEVICNLPASFVGGFIGYMVAGPSLTNDHYGITNCYGYNASQIAGVLRNGPVAQTFALRFMAIGRWY